MRQVTKTETKTVPARRTRTLGRGKLVEDVNVESESKVKEMVREAYKLGVQKAAVTKSHTSIMGKVKKAVTALGRTVRTYTLVDGERVDIEGGFQDGTQTVIDMDMAKRVLSAAEFMDIASITQKAVKDAYGQDTLDKIAKTTIVPKFGIRVVK